MVGSLFSVEELQFHKVSTYSRCIVEIQIELHILTAEAKALGITFLVNPFFSPTVLGFLFCFVFIFWNKDSHNIVI